MKLISLYNKLFIAHLISQYCSVNIIILLKYKFFIAQKLLLNYVFIIAHSNIFIAQINTSLFILFTNMHKRNYILKRENLS